MNLGEGFIIHLKSEENLVDFYFSVGDGHSVIEDFTFFEIGVCAEEFEVVLKRGVFEAATVFDDLFEGDTGPFCGSNCAFSPLWCFLISASFFHSVTEFRGDNFVGETVGVDLQVH